MDYGRNGLRDKMNKIKSKSSKVSNRISSIAIRAILLILVGGFVVFGSLLIGAYNGIIDSTPSVSDVNIMPSGYATFVYDADGNLLQKLNSASGNRIAVSISDMPENLQHAIVAIEDSRFYEHNGVDPVGMVRAAAVALGSGFARTEGASTITQQLLKNNVFTNWTQESKLERIVRKLQEQYLAIELEKALTAEGLDAKSVILENYLNTVNFGSGTYGVQAASLKYFGKDSKDLTLSECAVLAAIPQNPTKWNPIRYPVKLSGGMQQRVGIARAYCNEPVVMLLDEPFGHLDAQTRYMMQDELMRIWEAEKRTVVFVTNNIEEAVYLADRILVLKNCPTGVKAEFEIALERPRNYTDSEFLRIRKEIDSIVDHTL